MWTPPPRCCRSCRWRRTARWRGARRLSSSWSRCGWAWRARTTSAPPSWPRRCASLAPPPAAAASPRARQVSERALGDAEMEDLKLRYFKTMVEVGTHDEAYLDVCKFSREILGSDSVRQDKAAAHAALSDVVCFLALAPYGNEQADLVARVLEEPLLAELPQLKALLQSFVTKEVSPWKRTESTFGAMLRATAAFSGDGDGAKRYEVLRRRLVEHNIRVMSQCAAPAPRRAPRRRPLTAPPQVLHPDQLRQTGHAARALARPDGGGAPPATRPPAAPGADGGGSSSPSWWWTRPSLPRSTGPRASSPSRRCRTPRRCCRSGRPRTAR